MRYRQQIVGGYIFGALCTYKVVSKHYLPNPRSCVDKYIWKKCQFFCRIIILDKTV